jgi:predicted nucleotidyltransferase
MDIPSRLTRLVSAHPDTGRVVLVGSRASGKPTALSDWDFRIHTAKPGKVARDLPELVAPLQPPWEPSPANLAAIDAHFWDWTLWLGAKLLAEKMELVADELTKMQRHLLGPLGVLSPPTTVDDAVAKYRVVRDRLEGQWEVSVPRRLGDEVATALRGHGLV